MTTTPTTPREFADAIGAAWRETTEGVLRTAGLYHQARRQLGDSAWADLLANVPHAISTARRLAIIGRWHETHAGWLPTGQLPPHWGTLYALSRVPEAELRSALSVGKVHAGMERSEAEALVPKAAKAQAASSGSGVTQTAAAPIPGAPVALVPTLPGAVDMLLALKDAEQPAHYAQAVPRAKIAVALAFLTAVHKLTK